MVLVVSVQMYCCCYALMVLASEGASQGPMSTKHGHRCWSDAAGWQRHLAAAWMTCELSRHGNLQPGLDVSLLTTKVSSVF